MPPDSADESPSAESVPSRWAASAAYADMWLDPDDDPRRSDGEVDGEKATLVDYLGTYRLTLEMKCADLDPGQLARRSVPPSPMSLLGLIRHMADVERQWFRRVLAGQDAPPLYWSDDEDDRDWKGAVAEPEVVAQAWLNWRAEVAFAEDFASAAGDLGLRVPLGGKTVALRDVLVHMIEEYARHCGHADLLRERIDGRVGQ